MDSYSIIIKPHVSEKTMNLIDENNEIAFGARPSPRTPQRPAPTAGAQWC